MQKLKYPAIYFTECLLLTPHQDEILVTTSDGELYNIKSNLANQIGNVKAKLDTLGEPYFIPLDHVESLQDLDTVLNEDISRTIFNNLVQDFNIDHNMIYKLTVAAHNLDIPTLKKAAIQHLSDELKGCGNTEELRFRFGIPDNYQFNNE